MNDNDNLLYENGPFDPCVAASARPFYHLRQFVRDWAQSRDWKSLRAGLPAIVVAAAAMGTVWLGAMTSDKEWSRVYNAAAAAALKNNDVAAADVYFRRMAMLDGAAPAAQYGLAVTAARAGDEARAQSLMRRIAPDDAAGFPPAHLWLAKDLLKHHAKLTPTVGRVVEHHLRQALAGNENNVELQTLLGRVYASLGDLDSAIPHFKIAAQERPELKLALAGLYAMQHNVGASQQAAIAARDHFRQKAEAEPKVLDYRLQWARAEVFLENYAAAADVLQAGLESAEPRRFREALAEVYLGWSESIPDREKDSLARRLELLNLALTHNPKNVHALMLLADLATKDGEAADAARGELERALARGVAPATAHAILGTEALRHDDYEKARMHLELACARDPQTPAILNNLAWALANGKNADLPRALQLAQAAKQLSNHPEISVTIGTILACMGKLREAVTELEGALRAFPDRAELHGRLAELYDRLGDAELAKVHRRLAKPDKTSP
jgi:predicted Zn-dependent protease